MTITKIEHSDLQARVAALPLGQLVGNTPLIALKRIGAELPDGVRLFAKAEWYNPGESVKARPAWSILQDVVARGLLDDGKTLLDSTSGNMGIAYATFAAALGIPLTLTLPANASPERQALLRVLGAELVLTDPLEGSDGAIVAARALAAEQPARYVYANQYNNPANWQAHYAGTGPEIWAQTDGRVTHFVAGLGTSGTLMGVTRYLKEQHRSIQTIGFQPDAPFHGLEGLKHMPSAIPPGIYDPALTDDDLSVRTEDARAMTRRLAQEEGLFVGISSGAAAVAALEVARGLQRGTVVTVFPDAGYKYLSDAQLWEAR